jgi:hypothetical protein
MCCLWNRTLQWFYSSPIHVQLPSDCASRHVMFALETFSKWKRKTSWLSETCCKLWLLICALRFTTGKPNKVKLDGFYMWFFFSNLACNPISLINHVSFLVPHQTTYHLNRGVQLWSNWIRRIYLRDKRWTTEWGSNKTSAQFQKVVCIWMLILKPIGNTKWKDVQCTLFICSTQ